MEREKRNNTKQQENEISKRKWYSVIGFLISITLLSIAIFMSINQENNERLSRLNTTDVASTDLTRNLNEVKNEKNSIAKQTLTNVLDEIESEKKENSVSTNSNIIENNVTTENAVSTNANILENEIITNTNASENTDNAIQEEQNTIENNSENTNTNSNNGDKNTNGNESFIKPVEGEVINIFSMDSLVYSNTLQEWVTHRGLDIKSEKGAEVKASKSGVIKSVKTDPRYGKSVTIEHKDGFTTVYSCLLSTAELTEGDEIEQGQVIGNIGNSGVFEVSDGMHLHFEMLKDGEYVNPDIYIK